MLQKLTPKQIVAGALITLVLGIILQNYSYDLCVWHEDPVYGVSQPACSKIISSTADFIIILSAIVIGTVVADDWARHRRDN